MQEKALLEKAADLGGFSNLTNFVMTAARKEAMRILSDINSTYLSDRDWELVKQLLLNPPEPNSNLKKLFSGKDANNDKVDR